MSDTSKRSLHQKLIRLTLVAVLLSLLATLVSVALFEITTFRPRALESAKTQAGLVAEIIVPALEFDDARVAEKMLAVLRHEATVEAAGVYRVDGSRLVQYQRTVGGAQAPESSPTRLDRFEGQKIFTSVAVIADGTEIGRVWLQAEMPGWGDRVRQHALLLVLVTLAVIVLSLFISSATRKQITDPLHALSETVQLVSQSRDLQLRVTETGSGEISGLARSFNTMLETLAQHDARQREREARLARQNLGLVDMALAQKAAPDDTAGQARRLTEILCATLEVERASIWIMSADRTALICRDLYERSFRLHRVEITLPTTLYPAYFAALERERAIEAGDALTDPRTAELVKDYLKPKGIGSMLDAPLRWRGRLAGVLCLEQVGGPRPWQLDEVGFAISAADRVALFLEAEDSHLAAIELRDSEERYRSLIEEARDAIFTLSPEGEIIELNQAVEIITGWKRERWIGRNFTDQMLAENRAKAQALFAEVVRGGHPPSFELEVRTQIGSVVTMEFAISPRVKNGRVVGLLGIGRNVTERKKAGEAHAELEAQLRQAQKMEAIGNLAGGIAHDFNNILTAIIGNAQLAQMELPEEHQAHAMLGQTLVASHRAKDLVKQILTFSRREEQKRTPTHLGAVVKESIKLLRSVLPSSIQICARIPDSLPKIMADETQLHQIVVNLATNAAHAMEEMGGRLDILVEEVTVDREMISQRPQLKPGRFLRLWVTDTGAGMDEQTLQRIFEPFFTTKETGKGTGLGLAVVHGIVQQHDGAIVVYSVPGKGTSFQIYFPVISASAVASLQATPNFRSISPPPNQGAGRSVMVVDDDELVLSVSENVLRRAGYRVVPFSDPVLALQAFRETPLAYDLVITDLTMPRMRGTKLAAEMRAIRPGTPIILATGFGGGLETTAFQGAGLFGPLQKPFTSESLLEVVAAAIVHRA